MSWYGFFKVPFRAVVRFGYGARAVGEENIPPSGPVILAGNHIGAADTFVMPALITRKVIFPAKAEMFTGRGGPMTKLVAWFLTAVGQVPLDRSGGRASAAAPLAAESSSPCLMTCMSGALTSLSGGITPATSQNQFLP